jgi:hypothetical protein
VFELSNSNPGTVLVVLLLLAILLAVTNPSEEAHREAMAGTYRQEHPVAGAVGVGALSAAAPEYVSFVLGSYTHLGDEVTSIGVAGMVFPIEGDPR